ncbi:DUF2268 domain-containing protein [Gracilibacillus oryzae]|uniref:DUF2268 domain-containing protein n=1 Tax=Gracilibacillus oryzae TaxID=1672701 RepID=A0A7C8GTM2_9BACI|nr:DUF2268 domain-containing putative Zn-dependent protease [Gracilibacillus oryzae]KAB8137523.1 DUF2268 domain-containing protein [Gracilibacillus oryzae]
MTIQPTDKWLEEYLDSKTVLLNNKWKQHQNILCKPLAKYFHQTNAQAIQDHLLRHGLFHPANNEQDMITSWLKKDYHQLIEKLYQKYRKAWDGPAAKIFIFPSNHHSKELTERFSGCAGLSFPKQLFLFLSHQATRKQAAAVFLHEYSHTCRLNYFRKPEESYTLLDAIILEGIAEHLVRTIIGEDSGSKWIEQYPEDTARKYFTKWIAANINITRYEPKHDLLMYGDKHGIPQNLGYHMGYYILQQYIKTNKISAKQILYADNEEIIKAIDFLN